jgi:hypothetical protein
MDNPAPLPPRRHHRRCRYRVEQLDADHFAVVERTTNHIIIDGFSDYSSAWTFIANRLLDAHHV